MSDEMAMCTAIIEARLIELIQAIDELRRSLEDKQRQTPISYGDTSDANWYWNFG